MKMEMKWWLCLDLIGDLGKCNCNLGDRKEKGKSPGENIGKSISVSGRKIMVHKNNFRYVFPFKNIISITEKHFSKNYWKQLTKK